MTGSTIKGQIQREDLALFDGNTMTATRPNSSGGVQTGNRVGDAVDVKLIHGGSSNSASFQKAIDAMGTQNGSLLFTPETWNITSNITVPANVTLIVPAGCVFNIDSGITITNAGILFRFHKTFTSGSGTFTQNGTDILQIAGQSDIYGLDTGSTNTYVISTQASFSQYTTGLTVRFEPTSTNTGAATLNVDNLGPKTLRPVGSSSDVPVGSIKSGGIYTAVYDGGSDIFQVSDAIDLANISSSGDITLDAVGDIILDADGADISFKDAGTEFGKISNSSSDLVITSTVADKDIKFSGTDGSSPITPLTIDMSESGKVIVADDLALQSDSAVLSMGSDSEVTITHNHNTGLTLNDKDISGLSSINTGAIGTRNYINNPEFSVHQRGSTIDAATVGTQNDDGEICIDQWRLLSDGNDIIDCHSVTSTAPTGSLHCFEGDIETVDKKFGILQFIEQKNCASLFNETCTLSFQAKVNDASALDNIRCAIISWGGSVTADAPTKDIVSSWNDSSTNPTLVSNMTYENTPANLSVGTSFQKFSVTATIDTSSVKNIGVFIFSNTTSGLTAGTDKLHIGQVQLEKGSTPTSFHFEPYTDYLQRCQRYFQGYCENTGASTILYHTGHAFTTSVRTRFMLITPMRTGPTITFDTYNVIGKTGGAVTSITYSAVTTPDVNALGFNTAHSTLSNFNVPTNLNGASQVLFFVNTGGFFFISAELGA